MHYRYIGKSGLRVTTICLGTMTFGIQSDKKEAFKILDKAYDRGINFYDTAELYPVPPEQSLVGITEEILAQWLKTKPRESIILASKVAGAASGWFVPPIRYGLTAIDRFHIKKAVEGSLRRLDCEYIDLYQVHWPDLVVPIEESLESLDELVREGKIRYIGTSNDSAYGLTKANECSFYRGFQRFQSIQNNFSLLNPRFLDELANVCLRENISLLPYSPLAGGVLSGKYNKANAKEGRFGSYMLSKNPRVKAMARRFVSQKTIQATAEFLKIAKKHDLNPITMAIAWSIQHEFVASTIIGATKEKQLDETLAAIDLKLSTEVLDEIKQVQNQILYPMG